MKQMLPACVFLVCLALESTAQETEVKDGVKVGAFTSQVMVSTDFKDMYVNLVGTGIRYTRGDFAVAISLFPTLRFHKHVPAPDDDQRPFVTPGFSVGPLFQYKRLLIGFPSSYSYDLKWHFTVGSGVRLGRL